MPKKQVRKTGTNRETAADAVHAQDVQDTPGEFFSDAAVGGAASRRFGMIIPAGGREENETGSWYWHVTTGFEETINRNGGVAHYMRVSSEKPVPMEHQWRGLEAAAVFDQHPEAGTVALLHAHAARRKMNFISVTESVCIEGGDNVSFDYEQLGLLTVSHLQPLGYRRYILAVSSLSHDSVKHHIEGLKAGAQARGLTGDALCTGMVVDIGDERRLSRQLAKDLRVIAPGTAIIASSDSLASLVIAALERKGIMCGRDYGIVGCGDEPELRNLGITTFTLPSQRAGELAAKRLLGLLEDEFGTFRYALQPTLLRRRSTPKVGAVS